MAKNRKILYINSVNYGSTGTIMVQIANAASEYGYETYISYPLSNSNYQKKISNTIYIGNRLERNIHLNLAYYTGMNGCYSKNGTIKFLDKVTEINPDIIHLHNLHNCFINLELLFEYIKLHSIPVIWTLHDCWAFTGQCPHYTIVKCKKWKTECMDCPQYRQYPAARIDKTKEMFNLKKKWFTGVKNLKIITPSHWLKQQVKESFLNEYPVEVINNGIDLSIFKPSSSSFKQKYNLVDKIMLLGVANPWSTKKGLSLFIELSKLLGGKYKVVLVGLSKEQIQGLPQNILGLPKTKNQEELATLYSAADVFINPSLEETMGLVTVEALACGTPVIVSDSTAVPEVVNKLCGEVVQGHSPEDYYQVIMNMKIKDPLDCLEQAKKYDKNEKYNDYMKMYEDLLSY